MEYPIVFIGNSITNFDIRTILAVTGVNVSLHSMAFDSKTIEMTKITLSDFWILYEALSKKKAAFLLKMLRRFKDDLYNFVFTSEQKGTMRVALLEDERINEDTLAITFGLDSTGYYGLTRAVDSEKY